MADAASEVFKDRGKNFMTPEIIRYGWASQDIAYEISQGTGIVGEQIFGVTFANKWNPKQTMDYSSMVMSLEAANEYVESVSEELKDMPIAINNEEET